MILSYQYSLAVLFLLFRDFSPPEIENQTEFRVIHLFGKRIYIS